MFLIQVAPMKVHMYQLKWCLYINICERMRMRHWLLFPPQCKVLTYSTMMFHVELYACNNGIWTYAHYQMLLTIILGFFLVSIRLVLASLIIMHDSLTNILCCITLINKQSSSLSFFKHLEVLLNNKVMNSINHYFMRFQINVLVFELSCFLNDYSLLIVLTFH